MIYLALPYTHSKPEVVKYRKETAALVSSKFLRNNVITISPIVYGCALLDYGHIQDSSWEYWKHFCETVMDKSDSMYVLDLDGWDTSSGVKGEIQYMLKNDKKVFLIDPETLEIKYNLYE